MHSHLKSISSHQLAATLNVFGLEEEAEAAGENLEREKKKGPQVDSNCCVVTVLTAVQSLE